MELKLTNEDIADYSIDELKIGLEKSFQVELTQKLIDDFKSEYFNDFDNSFNYLARLFIEKRSYVNPKDLANSHERDWKLNENFYINFIQSIFKPIPFINTSEPSSEGNYRRVKVINDTKIELRKKSKLHISKYLKKYDLNDQVLLTTYALNPYGLIDILDDHFVLNSYKTSQWEDNYNKLQLFVGEHNRIPRSDKRIAETPKKELKDMNEQEKKIYREELKKKLKLKTIIISRKNFSNLKIPNQKN